MPSGRTIFLRTHNPDGSVKASAPAATTGGKSGHTVWLRTHNPDGSLIGTVGQTQSTPIGASESSNGGDATTGATGATGSPGKSGATLAARAQQTFINNIVHYLIIGGLIVGSIYAVRHFHLLTGGAPSGGASGGQKVVYIRRKRK